MEINEEKLRLIIRQVIHEMADPYRVPIGVSNHHIHLTKHDFQTLFPGQTMKVRAQLKQPGEFASEQTATVIGPLGTVQHVRILGPYRSHSQVEIARSEAIAIGVDAPIRLSGHLDNTPSVQLQTKDGTVTVQGVIVAKRHIHMSLDDAKRFGVAAGDEVSVDVLSNDRRTTFHNVVCRPRKDFVLEMHIDTDEANAANVNNDTVGHIIVEKVK